MHERVCRPCPAATGRDHFVGHVQTIAAVLSMGAVLLSPSLWCAPQRHVRGEARRHARRRGVLAHHREIQGQPPRLHYMGVISCDHLGLIWLLFLSRAHRRSMKAVRGRQESATLCTVSYQHHVIVSHEACTPYHPPNTPAILGG
jgi:hypothetical protein